MNKLLILIFGLLSFPLLIACSDDKPLDPVDNSEPNKPDIEVPKPEYPEGTFNYSLVKNHPRLLMLADEEESIKKVLVDNDFMKESHEYVINQCKIIVNLDKLTYKKDGKRLLAVSREALRRIFYLSYGYRMTGSQLYLIKAKAELNAVCDFADWNPSHYLDVGEMCMAVAIGYDWLYEDLDKPLKKKIRRSIVDKAFTTSKISSYNWFYDRENNWNQVCNAGLVYGALAILEDEPILSVEIIEKALRTNRKALEIYAPDGNYPEGPGYWGYGTTFQVLMNAALNSSLGNDAGLSEAKGFIESANYMMYSNSPSGQLFNFADNNSRTNPLFAMFWFADKTGNSSLLYEEVKLFNSGKYFNNSGEARVMPIALIFGKNIALDKMSAPQKQVWVGQGVTPIVIVRTGWSGESDKYLGIKAGTASTNHGHMDAGSFVYDVGATRWAMDFGMQSYEVVEAAGVDLWNMGQNSDRWDVFRLHNKNHNTLTINNQRHNVSGKATILNVFDSEDKKGASVDFTDVLNLSGELKSAVRTATIENNDFLQIIDQMEAGNKSVDVYWNMVCQGSAEVVGHNKILINKDGKKLMVEVVSDIDFKLEADRSTTPSKSYEASNKGTTMIGFTSIVPPNAKVTYTVNLKEQ